MKILVVEDDIHVNKVMAKLLELDEHDVVSVYNGAEAIKILNNDPLFDLIITDIIMPEKEGIELIKEIREKYREIKILAISGGGKLDTDLYLLLADKFGADGILKKPFDNDEFISAVNKVIYG